jgi:hypothetical protein
LSALLQLLDTSPAAATSIGSTLLVGVVSPHVAELADALGKVDVNSSVVNQNILHLEVCCLARCLILVFDECILETVACLLIPDDFTAQDFTEPAKNEFQVLIPSDRVQLADEQDVLGRFHFGKRQITHHLQSQGLCLRLPVASSFFQLLLINIVISVKCRLIGNPNGFKLLVGRRRTRARFP